MKTERHWPDSSDWILDVRRHTIPDKFDRGLNPILLVPGYCMNTTPLGFHPEGLSMIEYFCERGFEVWTSNLRGQGDSRSMNGKRWDAGFRELALGDLGRSLEYVRDHTKSHAKRVDVIGCSLGGTYVFVYLAHHVTTHFVGSIVAIGAPLRWDAAHPMMRFVFGSPLLASRLRISGTRKIAGFLLPLVATHAPSMLSMYMNTEICDLSCKDELIKTVEDPIPKLNGEIAHWFKTRDLIVEGVNVSKALTKIDRPLLCVIANRDGIVPREAAKSALEATGSEDRELIEVGTDETWFAHADLFISRHAQERVFNPIANFLAARAEHTKS